MRKFLAVYMVLGCIQFAYADKALVMTESTLSVTGLDDSYGMRETIDFDVRVPRANVIRARLEVILFQGSVTGAALYQKIRDYDRYTSVGSLSYKIALPRADRSGDLSLFVRVRGVRTGNKTDKVEPFEEKLTWPIKYRQDESDGQFVSDRGTLPDRIFFGLDSAQLSAQQSDQIEKWAQDLKRIEGLSAVRVEGHADRVGNQNYNLELSRRRAETVRRGLIKEGIARHLIDVVGYGFSKPSDESDVEDEKIGIAANRRAEVIWFSRKLLDSHNSNPEEIE